MAPEFVYGYHTNLAHTSLNTTTLMFLMHLASNINGTLFYPSTPDAPIGATISAKSNASILELNRLSTKLLTANHNKNHSTTHNSNRRQNYYHEWNRNGSCSSSSQQQGAEHICAYCKLPDFTLLSFVPQIS